MEPDFVLASGVRCVAIRVARRSIQPCSPSKSDEVLEAAEARLGGA